MLSSSNANTSDLLFHFLAINGQVGHLLVERPCETACCSLFQNRTKHHRQCRMI